MLIIFCSSMQAHAAYSDEKVIQLMQIQKVEQQFDLLDFPFMPEHFSMNEDGYILVAYIFDEDWTIVLFEPNQFDCYSTYEFSGKSYMLTGLEKDEITIYTSSDGFLAKYDFEGNMTSFERNPDPVARHEAYANQATSAPQRERIEIGNNILCVQKTWNSYTLYFNDTIVLHCGFMARTRSVALFILAGIGMAMCLPLAITTTQEKLKQQREAAQDST